MIKQYEARGLITDFVYYLKIHKIELYKIDTLNEKNIERLPADDFLYFLSLYLKKVLEQELNS
jgi:hypothetical protein